MGMAAGVAAEYENPVEVDLDFISPQILFSLQQAFPVMNSQALAPGGRRALRGLRLLPKANYRWDKKRD